MFLDYYISWVTSLQSVALKKVFQTMCLDLEFCDLSKSTIIWTEHKAIYSLVVVLKIAGFLESL